MAEITNLYVDAGSDFSAIITVADVNNNPMYLGGFTVKSQMRKSYGSTVAYPFDASIYDANAGQIQLILSADTSSNIKPGRYLYDVEINSPGNVKTRVVEGLVIISPEITQI